MCLLMYTYRARPFIGDTIARRLTGVIGAPTTSRASGSASPPSGLRDAGPTPPERPLGVPLREPELPCTTECGL